MNEAKFTIFAPLLKASMGDDGRRRLHGIASSTIQDRHGDKIELSALSEMERTAAANMTIFLNHKYIVPEDVAGSVERAVIRRHPTDADIHDLALDIVINETNERAVKAWEAIQGGTQLGLSIGARIPEGGASRNKDNGRYIIQHVDLLETSLVGVPANPRSWVEYAVKSLNGGIDPDEEFEELDLKMSEGTGVPMVGIELAEGEVGTITNDGTGTALPPLETGDEVSGSVVLADTSVEVPPVVVEMGEEPIEDVLDWLAKGNKKPAEHTHPHAHEHGHDHTHWNGIQHSHEHNHTHAHGHDDSHEHIDDKQGSEHDHSHTGSYGDNEHPHNETTKGLESELTGDELVAHLAEADPPPTPPSEGSDGAASAPQEAPESVPESGEAPAEPAVEEKLYEPITLATLQSANQILATVTRELIETRSALETAERERDQAVEVSTKALNDTASLLKRISETPMGRRTVVTEEVTAFDALKSVYGEAFVDLLTKKGTP